MHVVYMKRSGGTLEFVKAFFTPNGFPESFSHSSISQGHAGPCDFSIIDDTLYRKGKEVVLPPGKKVFLIDYDGSVKEIEMNSEELKMFNNVNISKFPRSGVWKEKLSTILADCENQRANEAVEY